MPKDEVNSATDAIVTEMQEHRSWAGWIAWRFVVKLCGVAVEIATREYYFAGGDKQFEENVREGVALRPANWKQSLL